MFKKDPKNSNLVIAGILSGILQVIYIFILITIGNQVAEYLRSQNIIAPILGSILLLTVFVFSAAVSALLVLGYPAYLLLVEKKTKEAILTLLTTLATLLLLGVVIFILLIAM